MQKKEFSIEEGQKVQAENLKFWDCDISTIVANILNIK